MTELDWRDLFRRYADWVGEQEGTSFLWGPGATNVYGVPMGSPWTATEWAAIEALMDDER